MKFMKELLEEIKPNKDYEKEILSKVDIIIKKINSKSKDVKAVLGGSGAKGTALKTFDADIFVKFNYSKFQDKSDKISDLLEKILKKSFKKIYRLHGSRDYFQIKEGKFTFEIVPILDIKKADQAKNITDVSPLHAKWVLKHKKLQDEMRLMKQFCKAQGVYGAESYIRGFSGYICEILTVKYGSFLKVIKNAIKWKDQEVIDVMGFFKRKDVFRELNKSKLLSPIIIIDPVQADRNAAAALSPENYEKFKNACKLFLNDPSKKHFKKTEFSIESIRNKNKNKTVLFVQATAEGGKDDVVGCKLVKSLEFFHKKLIENDFKVYNHGWEWDKKVVLYFILDKKVLPNTIKKEGPLVKLEDHVSKFKKKHKKTFTKGDRIFAIDKRKFKKPEELIKILIKNQYLKGKVKQVSLLK